MSYVLQQDILSSPVGSVADNLNSMSSTETLNSSESIRTQVPPVPSGISAAADNGVSKFRSPLLRQMMEGKLAKTTGIKNEAEAPQNQNCTSTAGSLEGVVESERGTIKPPTHNDMAVDGKQALLDEDKDVDESDPNGLYLRRFEAVGCNGDDTTKTSISDSTSQLSACGAVTIAADAS
jgi:hypothetical protein